MEIIDIAKRIDKSKGNEDWVNIENLGYELDVNITQAEQNRISCYWVGNWYCTDTYVGYRMYFLDDEPMAFSIQNSRKSDEKFYWFSQEMAIECKKYLLTLIENELNITICDVHEDIGDSFKINYNSEILNDAKATFKNEKVEIIEKIKNEPYGIDSELKIRLLNGEEKRVNVKDLDFSYHLK